MKHNNPKIKKNKKLFLRFLSIISIIVLFSVAYVALVSYQTLYSHINQPKQTLEVKKGENYYSLVSQWRNNIPFFSEIIAKLYIKTKVQEPLQIGSYEIPKNPNFLQIISVLQQGADTSMVKIQIIEGKTAKDLYQTLLANDGIKKEVLNLPKEEFYAQLSLPMTKPEGEFRHNLEGWFAPNTYIYTKGTTDKKILTDLYSRQQKILNEEWNNRATELPYSSAYDALIMASIIEKETSIEDERSLVAGVFVNRLKKGMKLQTDPTIIYGMGDRYQGDIRKKDIQEKTAYNTYHIDGLPPTPIALPSVASIKAALHPAKTDALFFVATGKGGHKFTKTYAEHKKAISEYLKAINSK